MTIAKSKQADIALLERRHFLSSYFGMGGAICLPTALAHSGYSQTISPESRMRAGGHVIRWDIDLLDFACAGDYNDFMYRLAEYAIDPWLREYVQGLQYSENNLPFSS